MVSTTLWAWTHNKKADLSPLSQSVKGTSSRHLSGISTRGREACHPSGPRRRYLDCDGAFLSVSLQVNLHFGQRLAFGHQLVTQFFQGITSIGDQLPYKHLRE